MMGDTSLNVKSITIFLLNMELANLHEEEKAHGSKRHCKLKG